MIGCVSTPLYLLIFVNRIRRYIPCFHDALKTEQSPLNAMTPLSYHISLRFTLGQECSYQCVYTRVRKGASNPCQMLERATEGVVVDLAHVDWVAVSVQNEHNVWNGDGLAVTGLCIIYQR